MAYLHPFKNIIYSACLLSTGLLSACGGGGGSEAPEINNIAPTVTMVGRDHSIEKETIELVANAEDIDGKISSYSWSVDSSTVILNGANSAEINFKAPDIREETTFKISLEVIDDDGAKAITSKEITIVPIKKEMTIEGQVVDEEIMNAQLTLEVGDESFTTQAGATAWYSFELVVDEVNFDKLVKITAIGHPDHHPDTKLVSFLPTFNTIFEQANSLSYLTSYENFAVNVTNLTTAQYILALQLNDGKEIVDDTTYTEIYQTLKTELRDDVLEVAVVIKAVVDSFEGIELPENIENSYELVTDLVAYQSVLDQINLQSDLYLEIYSSILADDKITEFTDFDNDGIIDDEDMDIDGDGVTNDPQFANTVNFDFWPKDPSQSAPHVDQLVFIDDDEEVDGLTNAFRGCLLANIRKIPGYEDASYTYHEYIDVPVNLFTDINCDNRSALEKLETINHFVNLTHFTANNTSLISIDGLAGIELITLEISDTHVSDFSVIADMTELRELNLELTSFSDINQVSNLTQLEVLNLASTQINSIAPLINFIDLVELDISGAGVADLTPINASTKLHTVLANDNVIVTLPNFANMPLLTTLSLYGNQIIDISTISSLSGFVELNLAGNQISDLTALANFTTLSSLDLSYNNIVDLTPLANLTGLSTLDLSHNNIVNLAPLANLTALTTLSLNHNQITDSSAISNMGLLVDFNIANNQLTNTNSLNNLVLIENLDLSENLISDISGLANLSALTLLDLHKNSLSNIAALVAWETMPDSLDIRENQISCDDQEAILAKVQVGQSYAADVDCVALVIATGGPFGVFHDGVYISEKTLVETFNLSLFGTNQLGSGGYNDLGEMDIISCYDSIDIEYPICFESNNIQQFSESCWAEENSLQMTCKNPTNGIPGDLVWPGIEFTVDFEQRILPGNVSPASFTNRLILNLFKSHYGQVDIVCTPLDQDNESFCEMTGDHFSGKVSWTQDHSDERFPRCSGEAGSSVATCTPAGGGAIVPSTDETGELGGLGNVGNSDYSFSIDISDYDLTEAKDRDGGEVCNPEVENCA